MSENHSLWRDGHKIFGCEQPRKKTPDEICEEFKMKMKPNQCPPILHGDCINAINDYLNMTRHIVNQNTGETAAYSGTVESFAVFTGLVNVAAYLSCAVRDGNSQIAESLDRLARAVENLTPTVEPPTLVRLRDVARRIGISSDALMRLSLRGEFPKVIYVADAPFYRESAVNEWLAAKAA